MLAGVCTGLEACDIGTASVWRFVFLVTGFFGGAGVLIYLGMIIALPQVDTPEEVKDRTSNPPSSVERGSSKVTVSGELTEKQSKLEKDLAYFKKLHQAAMISDEEYDKYRKEALDKNLG